MAGEVDILMFHSISDRGGPTSIAPDIFAAQMAALALSGRPVVGLDQVAQRNCPTGATVLTFDDAFEDFASTAWPILERYEFPAIVYVPSDYVGKSEGWPGALRPPRPLMDWRTIRTLSDEGVAFGNHTATHADLTSLKDDGIAEEVWRGQSAIEFELGKRVVHFAPPYGKTSARVRDIISKNQITSVGTRLGRADEHSDLFDLPRLEMYYFRSLRNWQRHLDGKGDAYLWIRRRLRQVRDMVSHPSVRV